MVAGFFRRTMDIVFCPRRAAIQELRATENWERIVRRINRIRRLRKYWAFLGRYLQQYSALRRGLRSEFRMCHEKEFHYETSIFPHDVTL